MNKCRNQISPIIPFTTEEYIRYKGDKRKNRFYKPKAGNEIRILTMDIAMMGTKSNDNTVFTLIRLIPNGNEYIKFVPFIETMNGENTIIQALRAKQLFYDLDCDYFVIDAAGVGHGVYDECTRIIVDSERNVEYPAWMSMNDEEMQKRAIDKDALPIVYSIKVAGANSTQVNHQMATYTKTQFEKNKIKLLVNESEGKTYLVENYKYNTLDAYEQSLLMHGYFQTTKLINEAINLKKDYSSGFLKLEELPGKRKDRVSSLMYGMHFVRLLESKLKNTSRTTDWSKLVITSKQNNQGQKSFFGNRFTGFNKNGKRFGR
jgi:hypothetical protein